MCLGAFIDDRHLRQRDAAHVGEGIIVMRHFDSRVGHRTNIAKCIAAATEC